MPQAISNIKGAAVFTAVLFCAAFSVHGGHADDAVLTKPISGLSEITVDADGRPVVVDGNGKSFVVALNGDEIELAPSPDIAFPNTPTGALQDGELAVSANGVRAWLDAPTTRYGHGVLGDAIEAGALTVEHADGTMGELTLNIMEVFEDRYPRFADMNGDGREEILVVKAYANAGGALVLVDPGAPGRDPRVVAEADAIGTPNRWLNPAGAGDVDGDGRMEALVVITPHIGGTLTAYEWRGNRLAVDHEIYGFSNHQIGARELRLSDVADLDGDGIAEVIVPDASRRDLTIVSFKGTAPRIVNRTNIGGRIAHRVVVSDLDRDGTPEIVFANDGGTLAVWQPRL